MSSFIWSEVAKRINAAGEKIGEWFNESVVSPFRNTEDFLNGIIQWSNQLVLEEPLHLFTWIVWVIRVGEHLRLGGITGAMNADAIKNFFFGKEEEGTEEVKDENGNVIDFEIKVLSQETINKINEAYRRRLVMVPVMEYPSHRLLSFLSPSCLPVHTSGVNLISHFT